ncbi:manganese efflux pump MntP family protein [Erythrobacter sp. NE805]|uniref:manganese efflux pump MntP n=1 Tax=Erythrobacter sp. NE805 TaxID=3389875 RepID=UPI00396AF3F6
MDAFAVALTQGARFRPSVRGGIAIAVTFGAFQAVMPLAGWAVGTVALAYVEAVDHWIAFGLLAFLGARMLTGHVGDAEGTHALTGRTLLVAGLATSIDALAAGLTLPTLGVPPLLAVALIGGVTALMSGAGVVLGRRAGEHLGEWAERAGGLILIGLGVKILGQHLGWL